ncbi:hypothetical protein LIER_12028 [Lithospermum erythrorhizon]|uniref:Uncharacterized protein n=1 Tax=Lithospermum erythrorhizon TaxID=34254 RepID=A0AAV3PRP2_LITER
MYSFIVINLSSTGNPEGTRIREVASTGLGFGGFPWSAILLFLQRRSLKYIQEALKFQVQAHYFFYTRKSNYCTLQASTNNVD